MRGLAPGATTLNYMVQHCRRLDDAFSALSDETRRGILEKLGHGQASISELAATFDMTLTGMKKHVGILEKSGLLKTKKLGRVRTCSLGERTLHEEVAWLEKLQRMQAERFDRLADFLQRTRPTEGATR